MRYVAMGDSYTIGVAVDLPERWPDRLASRLGAAARPSDAGTSAGGPSLDLVANVAVEGHASADLIRDQLPILNELQPEFVSLLIGAEDVVQSIPENAYAENVTTILDELLGRVPPGRILTVAIPDFTVTPRGAELGDPARNSAAVARANELMGEAADARGIAFVAEPFALSREAIEDRSLVAADDLHPSAAQYARWVDAIAPIVERLLVEPVGLRRLDAGRPSR